MERVEKRLLPVLARIRRDGDCALRYYSRKFDCARLKEFEVDGRNIRRAASRLRPADARAIRRAAALIARFHRRQGKGLAYSIRWKGAMLGRAARPYDRVGLYAPGGRATYPSSVLMAAIPARIAGVREVVLCTPPSSDGAVAPALLHAASVAGVDRVFALGGAHAVFAMALGTVSVPRVEKIAGPGGLYVTAAKRMVRQLGLADIDMLAGPSELLIIADGSARPEHLAWDLLAQAEHDPSAAAVLVTTSRAMGEAVRAETLRILPTLKRMEIAGAALAKNCAVVIARKLDEALGFSNEYAPEHLEIVTKEPGPLLSRVKSAGSVFLGPHSPVAAGDYCSGPNHILPTGSEARWSGGLSVETFLRTFTYQSLSEGALRSLAPTVERLARLEGLEAHARSVSVRRSRL